MKTQTYYNYLLIFNNHARKQVNVEIQRITTRDASPVKTLYNLSNKREAYAYAVNYIREHKLPIFVADKLMNIPHKTNYK